MSLSLFVLLAPECPVLAARGEKEQGHLHVKKGLFSTELLPSSS